MVADINPCGAVVDFIRRSYRTTVRPFRDSEETAEIVWYPALPDAPTLPFPTTFNTGDQNPVFIDKTSPGEVYGEPRPFVFEEEKAHAFGIHQCGSAEDFVEGVEYDPEQIVPYNDDGLPVCCNGWERGPCGCGAAGAEVSFPADGCACATAYPIPFGVLSTGSYCSTVLVTWFTITVPTSGNVRFRFTFGNPGFNQGNFSIGTCDGTSIIWSFADFGPVDRTEFLAAGEYKWNPFTFAPSVTWTARLDYV